jgi:hypothetical protein
MLTGASVPASPPPAEEPPAPAPPVPLLEVVEWLVEPDELDDVTTDEELDDVVVAGLLDEQATTTAAASVHPRVKRMSASVGRSGARRHLEPRVGSSEGVRAPCTLDRAARLAVECHP